MWIYMKTQKNEKYRKIKKTKLNSLTKIGRDIEIATSTRNYGTLCEKDISGLFFSLSLQQIYMKNIHLLKSLDLLTNPPTQPRATRSKRTEQIKNSGNEQDGHHQKPSSQDDYQPPHLQNIQKVSLPTKEEFQAQVLLFISKEDIQLDLQVLYVIYKQVNQKGGTIDAQSIGSMKKIIKEVAEEQQKNMNNSMFPEIGEQKAEQIQNILFTFQFLKRNPNCQKKIYYLGVVNFIDQNELKGVFKNKKESLKYFNYDLTLFQEGAEAIKYDKNIFNCEYMCNYYGEQKIDIRIQNPCDFGFYPYKMKNKPFSMLLKDYRYYQKHYNNKEMMEKFVHIEHLKKGQVFFGVNFEPSNNQLNQEVKKTSEGSFLDFHADFDLLSYMDQDIPGCSIPQMYFKVPGVWTGGHQQNIAMSALNINHGPDASQWYTLDLKYVEDLRSQLLRQFNIDLYVYEGLWYQSLDWFIEKGYPVKRFLQRKDDIVVTGPGTLHWVRSFGSAIQTSWNMFPKNYEQFVAAYHRQEQNKKIQFRKSDIIPLKVLTLRYLNHERGIMNEKTKNLCLSKLKEWLKAQKEFLSKSKINIQTRKVEPLSDSDTFCQRCFQQVFLYYLPPDHIKKRGVVCVFCCNRDDFSKKKKTEIPVLYKKFEQEWINELIKFSQAPNIMNHQEIPELCTGIHVGKTQCKLKEILQKINKEKIEEDVIEDPMKKSDMISEFHYLRRQNKALSNGHDALLKCLEKILKNTDLLTVRMDSLERKFDEIKPRQEEGRKRLKRIEKESSSGEYEQRLERSREKGKRSRRRTNGNGNSEVKVENRRKEEESNQE